MSTPLAFVASRSADSLPSASPPSTQSSTLPSPYRQKRLTPAEADTLMQAVTEAINRGQGNTLLPYMLDRDQREENIRAAIEDYRTYFQGEAIEGFERQSIEQLGRLNQQPIQRFNYRIYSASGISKEISIYQDQQIRLTDDFFLFSYWAKRRVVRFVNAIQAEDAEAVAKTLTADDFPYPISAAEQAIDAYRAIFDLSTLQAQFTGLAPGTGNFTYVLSGTQSDQPTTHSIQLIHGDGLVSLKDELVPDLP